MRPCAKLVDPRRAVGPAHDPCLARPVLLALQRVGQCLALETLRVRQHVADGAPGQIGVVELKLDIRPQYAFALPEDDLSRRGLR